MQDPQRSSRLACDSSICSSTSPPCADTSTARDRMSRAPPPLLPALSAAAAAAPAPAALWNGQPPALLLPPPLLLLPPARTPMAARRRCRMASSWSSSAACSRCVFAWFHGSSFSLQQWQVGTVDRQQQRGKAAQQPAWQRQRMRGSRPKGEPRGGQTCGHTNPYPVGLQPKPCLACSAGRCPDRKLCGGPALRSWSTAGWRGRPPAAG